MKTSNYSEPEYADCEEPAKPEPVFRKVEILHVESADCDDRWSDPAEWKDSQASPASSEISVHREPWRDIVSPVEVEPDWKDSQASLASSEVSVQREREGAEGSDLTSPPSSDVSVAKERERWSDCRSPPEEVTDSAVAPEPSEYYTASSEVSLLSDTEPQGEDRGEKKECVVLVAGHVAAMRERFESMTRANTPCPDLVRSTSPSLDVFRNITPSPDRLG